MDQGCSCSSRDGRLVSFDTLRHHFETAGAVGAVHYLQAASVVAYLDRVYGRARLRAFWASGGFGSAERTLGVGPASIERDWRASLAGRTPSVAWAEIAQVIAARGCE